MPEVSDQSPRLSTAAFIGSWVLVVLVGFSSLAGLVAPWAYASETPNWSAQAQGQDIGNLVAVIVLAASSIAARRGSFAGLQIWLGTQLYIAYAMAIYAFTIHFGPLFLVYVLALGLSVYSIGFVALAAIAPVSLRTTPRYRATWVLLGLAIVFALLWLASILPAMATSSTPADLVEAGLVSNPVHVLDLALILPAMALTAIGARRASSFALLTVSSWLVFSTIMALSIVAGMILLDGPLAPMLVLSGVSIASAIGAWSSLTPSSQLLPTTTSR